MRISFHPPQLLLVLLKAVTLSALWIRFFWKSAHGMTANELLVFTKLKGALQDEQSLKNIPEFVITTAQT
jgi:hypothetical protein